MIFHGLLVGYFILNIVIYLFLRILCHCAERAKKQGYKYFGLQYYAECWSAPGEINYKKYGAATKCIDSAYQECSTAKDQPCSGEDGANYVYKLL